MCLLLTSYGAGRRTPPVASSRTLQDYQAQRWATVSLTLDEVPQPEFPFPHPDEVFGSKCEDGNMANSTQTVESQGFKFAIPEMADYGKLSDFPDASPPEPDDGWEEVGNLPENMPICQNVPDAGWQIKTVEPQGLETNLPFCHPPTIEHLDDEYGEDLPANVPIRQNVPDPVWQIKGVDSQGLEANVPFCQPSTTDAVENCQLSESDYLTALEREFKKLKRLHSADRMSYYYNSYRKEWELIKGNQTVCKIPVANGLSVEECIQKLREAFELATQPTSKDPFLDF